MFSIKKLQAFIFLCIYIRSCEDLVKVSMENLPFTLNDNLKLWNSQNTHFFSVVIFLWSKPTSGITRNFLYIRTNRVHWTKKKQNINYAWVWIIRNAYPWLRLILDNLVYENCLYLDRFMEGLYNASHTNTRPRVYCHHHVIYTFYCLILSLFFSNKKIHKTIATQKVPSLLLSHPYPTSLPNAALLPFPFPASLPPHTRALHCSSPHRTKHQWSN